MFKYTLFDSVKDTNPKQFEADWQELCRKFTDFQIVPAKTAVSLFVAASFNGTRSAKHVENVYLLVLDFDNEKEIDEIGPDGKPTKKKIKVRIDDPVYPEIVEAQLQGHAYIIYSSFRNKPDHPKFRAIVALATSVPGDKWEQVSKALLDKLGLLDPYFYAGLDKALYIRPAQLYYLPSAPNRDNIYSSIGQGTFLSVPANLPAGAKPRSKSKKDNRFTAEQISTYFAIRHPNLNQVGDDWRSNCILHGGEKREDSLSIVASSGLWTCYSCGKGGDIYTFERELLARERNCTADEILFREVKESVDDLLGIDDGVLPGAENFKVIKKELETLTKPDDITPDILTKVALQPVRERRELEEQLIQTTQINPDQLQAEVEAVRAGLREETENKIAKFPKSNPDLEAEESTKETINSKNEESGDILGISIPGDRYVVCPVAKEIYPVKQTPKGTQVQYDNPIVPRWIWISEMADDYASDEVYAKLNWLTSNMQKRSIWIEDKKTNSKEFLTSLTDAPMCSEVGQVSKWLAYNKRYVSVERVPATSRLGWIRDQFIFDEDQAGLLYMGTPVARAGTADAWFEGLDALLAACPDSLGPWAVLGLSVAAPLVRHISHRNPVIGLIAETSSGKSISIGFALSIWTNPDRSTIPAGSTWKGIQDHSKNLSDTPVFLDELQQAFKKHPVDAENTIYFCGNGQLRVKSTVRGVSVGGEKHYGVTFFAAEQEVIGQSQLGAQVRTIEIVGSPLPDAAIANYIREISSENYGQVGLLIAAFINANKDAYIQQTKQYQKDFEKSHPGTKGTDSHVIAITKMGLEILSQISGRNIDADKLANNLADYVENQRAFIIDSTARLWNMIVDTVLSSGWGNQDVLGDLDGNVAYRGKELMDQINTVLEINPTSTLVQRILTTFSESERIAAEFVKRGWLIQAPDRNKWKRSGSGKSGIGSRTWRVTKFGVDVCGGL